jgi:diguanylate cyclase (GGDEF)-like protein
MFTLWFLFIGVTQAPGTGWVLVLPAAAVWLEVSGGLNERNIVRIGLGIIVWGLAADLLAVRERVVGQRHESLQQEAGTDPLTGLANRRSLQRTLDTLRPGDDVILLDLDHFKQINDTRGHDGGDRVLVDFAAVLTDVVRSGDVVARYGGEEFVLVLRRPRPTGSPARAGGVTDAASITSRHVPSGALARLRTRWAELHPDITWSGGLCQHSDDRTVAQTLALADQALYEAKRSGRDRVVVSDGIAA